MRLQEGQIVDGRYRLTGRIGAGGMADVWKADDTELGREVALKVLYENFARDEEFVERFRREASAAAALQHPNVVSVFDRGRLDDTYYIAMEYVEGSSLRDLIDDGRLTTEEAVEVARQVLSAAGAAHAAGIVHRDLKPLNVLIDRSGRVRVTDFGIANAGDSEITRTGSVMGTAQYLSPEQAQGGAVTAAVDIYAVGVMLFEMLTGSVPFDGDNAVAVAMKQVSEQPPAPSTIKPAVPPAVDSVVLRALAKDPANRYASAAEMLTALDAAEANPNVAGHTARHAAFTPPPETDDEGRPRWIWAAALLGLVAAGVALALLLGGGDDGVRVPTVINDAQGEATRKLREAGFEVDVDQAFGPAADLDKVMSQDPKAGTRADEGSSVTIVIGLGQEPVEIPDVTGLGVKKATNQLNKAGFENIEQERRFDEGVQAGKILDTEPSPGTAVGPDETITLTVSDGTETIAVPDVVGLNRNDAAAELRNAGFIPNQDFENSDAPEDEVLRQNPAAGTELASGKTVTIIYSNGAGTVVLNDYVGAKQRFAERKLGKQGVETNVDFQDTSSENEDGKVLSQSPGSGTRVQSGSTVRLVVGRFVEPDTTTDTTTGDGSTP